MIYDLSRLTIELVKETMANWFGMTLWIMKLNEIITTAHIATVRLPSQNEMTISASQTQPFLNVKSFYNGTEFWPCSSIRINH